MRRRRRLAAPAGAGLALLAIYVGLSFLNSPQGYLGTDTGGKVATMRVMAERGRFDPDLGYWAKRWDPSGALHPIGYTTRTASGTWVNVTTLPALWVGWQLFRVGGYRVSLLVPMAGAIAACFAGRALLRRLGAGEGHAWRGFWLLGLASPLAIYALDFWEHTLGVALMAWAVVLVVDVAVRRPLPWWRAAAAGVLFGASATMRTESLVYLAVAGVVGPSAFFLRSGRVGRPKPEQIVGAIGIGGLLAAGAAVPLFLNELLERRVIGSTLRGARVAGTALGIGDAAASRLQEAGITLFGLEGSPTGLVLGAMAVALLVFAALRRDTAAAVVAVAGAAVLALVRAVAGGLGFVPGLGPAWVLPAAAAATAAAMRARPEPFVNAEAEIPASTHTNDRTAPAVVLAVALGAIPLVLATQFRGGAGPQWAGRYLLVSGFLLAVLGWAALERRPPVLRTAFAGLALATTAFGLVWLHVRSHDVDRTIATLERRPEPVLVSGVYHLAREGGATYGDKRWLTLSPTPQGTPAAVAKVLQQAGIDRFASVELAGERPRRYPGFTAAGTSTVTLFEGVDLRVTSWRRSP